MELGKEEYVRDPEAYQHSLSTLVSFAKLFREEFLGLSTTDAMVAEGAEGRDWWIVLATSYNAVKPTKRLFEMRLMTWRALSTTS